MPKPTQPPFGQSALQGQPEAQAAPSPVAPCHTIKAMAERHEALWLSLHRFHKDTLALGAKKPDAPVSDPLRITAESLLSDCAEFTRKRGERLVVAAADLAGLAVQLGQAFARLDEWESHHTTWDERFKCRVWNLHTGYLPIMRLKPPAAALKHKRDDIDSIREKLALRIDQRYKYHYQQGFEAGRAARIGEPEPEADEPGQTYPRLRQLG